MPSSSHSQVIQELSSVVGAQYVLADAGSIKEAETATYKSGQTVVAIVKPRDAVQLQAIVTIARHRKTPMYVYSTGKNWGYGSRVPRKSQSFLIDLSRMNKILEYDKELGYVTLEPGVTQQQLYDFLKKQKAPYSVSTTGSAPDTSIIGNICERGVGKPPYGFRSHYIGDLEALLPSGNFIHTGFGRFANAKAAKVYPEGIGPSFYDAFLQSNYGIITKLTMFLAPMPNYSQIIDISVASYADLPKYLKLLHTFNFFSASRKFIGMRNDLEMLFVQAQYPWKAANNKTPLPAGVLEQLKKQYGITYAWKAHVLVYGYTREEVAAQISYFKSLAKHVDGITVSPVFSDNTLGDEPKNISNSMYWRMKTKPPAIKNPDTDGCGLIRLSMAVPFTSENICEVTDAMTTVITQYKYEPFIEAHCISERAVVVIAPIIFDRTQPGEDENALSCHDALLKLLMDKGYYPYRDNGRAMMLFPSSSDGFDAFQQTIKHALDPDNIFSPGRYEVA